MVIVKLKFFIKGVVQRNIFPLYFISKITYRLFYVHYNNWKIKKNLGISNIQGLQLPKNKVNTTLFILGTGASVNQYKPEQWKIIRDNFSIGINYWVLHDFIPDLFMLEFLDEAPANNYDKILRTRVEEIKSAKILLSGNYLDPNLYLRRNNLVPKLPAQILRNAYLLFDFPVPGDSENGLKKSLNWLYRLGLFNDRVNINYVPQVRATITTAIHLGFKLGFKKIVLCGVDLNNTTYFFSGNEGKYRSQGLTVPDTGQTGSAHLTDLPLRGAVPVSGGVKIIQQEVADKLGAQIYVGAKTSALYGDLPVYPW